LFYTFFIKLLFHFAFDNFLNKSTDSIVWNNADVHAFEHEHKLEQDHEHVNKHFHEYEHGHEHEQEHDMNMYKKVNIQ
jgi:hypothetical protein